MPKLYYLQAPSFAINPDSNVAPRLGSIFYSLERLIAPLNQSECLAVSDELRNKSAITKFCDVSRNGVTGGIGLNTSLVQGLAGSGDVLYGFSKHKMSEHSCELLETDEFEPSGQFIRDSIKASRRVQNAFEHALPGRKRVYMITGIKIATGLCTKTSRKSQHGPVLSIGFDATALGIPAAAGPQVEFTTAAQRTTSHGPSLNRVIFAYRVIRIKWRGDGEVKWEYKAGGKYSLDDADSEDDEDPWGVEMLDVGHVSDDFPNALPMEVV
jgi:hypothetical protein